MHQQAWPTISSKITTNGLMQAKYHLSPWVSLYFTLKASFIQPYYSVFQSHSPSHTIPCHTHKVSTTDLLKRLARFTLNIITFTNIYFHPKIFL